MFLKKIVILFFVATTLLGKAVVANTLLCRDQQTDPVDTKCGKIYQGLVQEEKINKNFDLLYEWKKYKCECDKNGEYESYLADILQDEGRHKEAQDLLEEIIKGKGEKYDVRFAYGVLMHSLMHEEKYEKAKKIAFQAMLHYPYWFRGYLNYGELLINDNEFFKAKEYIEKSMELQPDYSEAYGALAIIYRLHFRDDAAAVKLYKKAISMNQHNLLFSIPDATFEVVSAAMTQKDYKLAVWILDKQIELYPKIAQEAWYIELKAKVYGYFKHNNIGDPFTPEERKALADGADPLDIIGRD